MARFITANDIINRVAIEVGILPTADPVGSTEEAYIQLTGLLTAAGQEMIEINAWEGQIERFSFTVLAGNTGIYSLPDDYAYMVDQTGWDFVNLLPIAGPLNAQQWAAVTAQAPLTSLIYSSFRLIGNDFEMWPKPAKTGMGVSFEYISRNWVQEAGPSQVKRDTISDGGNIVLFEPILMVKFLKLKWLTSKGFDASAAALDFDTILQGRMGRDAGAPILNAGSGSGFPYLNAWRNVPSSFYGM